jgi:hypothetical protein
VNAAPGPYCITQSGGMPSAAIDIDTEQEREAMGAAVPESL